MEKSENVSVDSTLQNRDYVEKAVQEYSSSGFLSSFIAEDKKCFSFWDDFCEIVQNLDDFELHSQDVELTLFCCGNDSF